MRHIAKSNEKEKRFKTFKKSHQKIKTLAVIPCYNEEATIGSIIIKTKRYVNEVLVINDGSNDDNQ